MIEKAQAHCSVHQTCDRPATRLDHKSCQLSGSSPIDSMTGINFGPMISLFAHFGVLNMTSLDLLLYPNIKKGQKPTKINECLSPALMEQGVSKKSQIRSNFGDTGAWSLADLLARYKK